MGKEWKIFYMNFENVGSAIFSLFLMSTLDGTIDFFLFAKNSSLDSIGPVIDNNLYSSVLFFMIFIFFGTLFLIDLFTAVLYYNFKLLHTSLSEGKFFSSLQLTWIELQRKILRHKYSRNNIYYSYNSIRKKLYKFFKTEKFILIKSFIIVSNIVLFCIDHRDQGLAYTNNLFIGDSIITYIMLFELILKFSTFGKKNFLIQTFNILDTFICATAITGVILYYLSKISYDYYKIFSLIKLLRIFYIIEKFNGATKILVTIQFILPGLFPFFILLLLLIIFFGAIGGLLYFDFDKNSQGVWSFKNYFSSYLFLLKISTLDSVWSAIERYVNYNRSVSLIFFSAFMIFSEYIFYNLFSMAFINQFEDYYLKSKNPMLRNKSDLENFDNTWEAFTSSSDGNTIKAENLLMFLRKLRYPLGLKLNNDVDFYFEAYKMKIMMFI